VSETLHAQCPEGLIWEGANRLGNQGFDLSRWDLTKTEITVQINIPDIGPLRPLGHI
jgi:hypothetical protein